MNTLTAIIANRHSIAWTLPAIVGVSPVLAFFSNRYAPNKLYRCVFASLISLPLLLYPIGTPLRTAAALMGSSLSFMVATRVLSSAFLSPEQTKKKPFWSDFISQLCAFGFYAFSIRKTKQPKAKKEEKTEKEWSPIFQKALLELASCAFKIIASGVLERTLFYLTTTGRQAADLALSTSLASNSTSVAYPVICLAAYATRYLHTCSETIVFATSVAALSNASTDAMNAVLRIASRGEYEIMPFNNWVVLSKSLRELWGKRYNLLINHWMRENFYDPLRNNYSISNTLAANTCFAASAILHVYVTFITFGGGLSKSLRSLSFFILHGFLCTYERKVVNGFKKIMRYEDNGLTSRVWTWTVMFLSLPIYLGHFTESYPKWGITNPAAVHDISNMFCDAIAPSSNQFSLAQISQL